jgi:hypothetical protein
MVCEVLRNSLYLINPGFLVFIKLFHPMRQFEYSG